jgi:hypothetical protein
MGFVFSIISVAKEPLCFGRLHNLICAFAHSASRNGKVRRNGSRDPKTSSKLLAFGNPVNEKRSASGIKPVRGDQSHFPKLREAYVGQLYGAARSKVYIGADAPKTD